MAVSLSYLQSFVGPCYCPLEITEIFLISTRLKEKMAQAMTALTTYEKTDTSDRGIISDTRGRMITVQIPDMFTSFLSVPPRVNLLYGEVKSESEAWISEY
jgi:hypothetical protein